ncbi:MAG TPA: Maf family nucleotide pyrophosphatase [Xanthomonadaceae bacterium]|nr:Maf family nucleotide pyrophosphatase [Xanthomonadaceae bacterium]
MPTARLTLASTSTYRRQLLDRLGLPYSVVSPTTDESRLPDEAPHAMSERLARAKADAVAALHPDAWVIGSDQVAECDAVALGKPGDHARAVAQLRAASGRTVRFHTSVCLRCIATAVALIHRDVTEVVFRTLDDDSIERYLRAERPYDCAGSFKSEGLGIALFESIRSDDPTALIGLPLIALARMLREAGFSIP